MRWTTALTISLLISTIAWGGEPASLSTSGNVWTNKVLLPSGTTLHEGDNVQTDRDSVAVIASRSTGRVEIREKSAVSLGEGQVVLHQGVISTKRASVQLGDVLIKPQGSRDALVVVARRGERILIAAHRGDALISQPGAAPLLLPAGSYAIPAEANEESDADKAAATEKAEGAEETEKAEPAAKEDDDDDGGSAVPAAVGAGTDLVHIVGWVIQSLGTAGAAATVASVGAVAVGVTAAGFALKEDSPSPSTL